MHVIRVLSLNNSDLARLFAAVEQQDCDPIDLIVQKAKTCDELNTIHALGGTAFGIAHKNG